MRVFKRILLTSNKRKLLKYFDYKSVKGFRTDNTEFKSNADAYASMLSYYNTEMDNLERERRKKVKKNKKNTRYSLQDLEPQLLQRFGAMFNTDADKSKPITVRLVSRVLDGVVQTVTFNNYFHFQAWLDKEKQWNDNEINSGTDDTLIGLNANANVTDAFASFSIVIDFASGGSDRSWSENKTARERKISFLNYKVRVFDPATTNIGDNNCGIRCLSKLLNKRLDAKKVRKLINSPARQMLTPQQLSQIYTDYGGKKKLVIIAVDNEDDFDLEMMDYVLLKDSHYTVVIEAVKCDHAEGKTKQHGVLAFDIETRPTNEVVMIGEEPSRILKSAILSVVYKPNRGEKQTFTLVSDSKKNCCRKFLDWLGYEANAERYYNCVAHNGSRFDFYLLMRYFNEVDLLASKTQLRGTSIIGLQYKSHTFKDTCCFLTNSLSNLCKGYLTTPDEKAFSKISTISLGNKVLTNYQLCFYKPELNFDEFLQLEQNEPAFWCEYVKYCEYDCESLFLIWEKFKLQINTIIGKMGEWLKCKVTLNTTNTIGSLSKKLLDTIHNVRPNMKPTPELLNIINRYKQSCGSRWKFGVKKADYDAEIAELKRRKVPLRTIDGGFNGKPAFKKYALFMNDKDKYNFIMNFKRGGISHCNQQGLHKEGIVGYDIKSQYPTALMRMMIPVGISNWVTKYDVKAFGFYNITNIVWECDAKKFKPVANKLDTGVLDWAGSSHKDLFVDGYMIKYLQEHCGLKSFNVKCGLVSAEEMCGSELFDTYVNTLYLEKAKQDILKDSKNIDYNQPYREAIKLLLNSLTGKLVEDPSRYFKLKFNSADKKAQTINGISISKTNTDEDSINPWVVAGVMVYSYSKRILWDYVNCLPNKADDVTHIETDGLYFSLPLRSEFLKNVEKLDSKLVRIGNDLGNVECEVVCSDESFFIGKKDYMIGLAIKNDDGTINYDKSKIRNKGIPKRTINIEGSNIDLLDEQFYIDRYNGKAVTKTFSTINKTLYDTAKIQGISLSSYFMTRTSTPHNFKNFKVYSEQNGKVLVNDWEKR